MKLIRRYRSNVMRWEQYGIHDYEETYSVGHGYNSRLVGNRKEVSYPSIADPNKKPKRTWFD